MISVFLPLLMVGISPRLTIQRKAFSVSAVPGSSCLICRNASLINRILAISSSPTISLRSHISLCWPILFEKLNHISILCPVYAIVSTNLNMIRRIDGSINPYIILFDFLSFFVDELDVNNASSDIFSSFMIITGHNLLKNDSAEIT